LSISALHHCDFTSRSVKTWHNSCELNSTGC